LAGEHGLNVLRRALFIRHSEGTEESLFDLSRKEQEE
jgi:hypothetical protein